MLVWRAAGQSGRRRAPALTAAGIDAATLISEGTGPAFPAAAGGRS